MNNSIKSKILKYKKEIEWLLREKYLLPDTVILNLFQNFSIESKFTAWMAGRQIPSNVTLSFQSGIEKSSISSGKRIPRLARYWNDDKEKILEDIARIINGEPVDYVIGFKEFLNCKIDLSIKPLIPRPETEFWVKWVLDRHLLPVIYLNPSQVLNILDLCCGSGCIGVSLLKNIPNCNVTFVDISENALAQTRINLYSPQHFEINLGSREQKKGKIYMLKKIQHRSNIVQSNLFSKLKGRTFDYIFCNPPYVKNIYIKGSLNYEPKIALDGKKDGLEIIYKILSQFQKYLNPGGKLFLEFGYGQKAKINKFLRLKMKNKDLQIKEYKFEKDQFGKYRVLKLQI